MLRPTLSRYHLVTFLALALGVAAFVWHSVIFGLAVLGAYGVIIGLGVAIPRLRLFGPFVCQKAGLEKCVALTFDDGPDPRSTPALLDLLRESGVKAAFFCIGKNVAENPALTARILSEGHLVENHSYWHRNTTNFFSVARLRAELEQAQTAIRQATGVAPTCFRPPMGLSNPRVFSAAKALRLTVVGWTARGFDTQCRRPDRVVARILRRVKPGAIILLHDGNIAPSRLLPTVKSLLDSLNKLGYQVARLDCLLK